MITLVRFERLALLKVVSLSLAATMMSAPLITVYAQEVPMAAESLRSSGSVSKEQIIAPPLQTVASEVSDKKIVTLDSKNIDIVSDLEPKHTEGPEAAPLANVQQQQVQQSLLAINPSNGDNPPTPVKQVKPETDASTGALSYSHSIVVPQGRNGMTPSIALNYNSQSGKDASLVGYGWNITIPYIERVNKKGTETLYSQNEFTSSVSGELANIAGSTYMSRSDGGEMLKYSYSGTSWTVTDKAGTTYTYGTTAQSRQDNPADTAQVSKWMLEKTQDSNGNSIDYTYYKNDGQIYPDTITYTNAAGLPGIYKITFSRISRSDVIESYATAYLVRTSYIISDVRIYANNILKGKYIFSYTQGNNGLRSLLSSITETRYDANGTGVTLPAEAFAYNSNIDQTFKTANAQSVPGLFPTDVQNGVIVGDINGDAYPDALKAYEWTVYTYTSDKKTMLFNPTTGLFAQSPASFNPPAGIMNYSDGNSKFDGGTRLVDLNGDLKPDLLRTPYAYNASVMPDENINTGAGWTNVPYTPSSSQYPKYTSNPWYSLFTQDFNGDGLVDYLQDTNPSTGGLPIYYNTTTSLNTGTNFNVNATLSHAGTGTVPLAYTPIFSGRSDYFMMDINGDKLPDFIQASRSLNNCGNCQYVYTDNVYINTGTNWVLDNSYILPPDFYFLQNAYFGTSYNKFEIADFNNDGLDDIYVIGDRIYTNTGKGFASLYVTSPSFTSSISATVNCLCQNPYLLMDINADGAQDFVANNNIYPNTNTSPNDLLKTITLPAGGSYGVTYKSSAQYKDQSGNLLNPSLPLVVTTVAAVTVNDGYGSSSTTSYSYADGYYYYASPSDRKFAGFGVVTETRPDAIIKTYYHQGNSTNAALGELADSRSKIGKPYRKETYNLANNLYQTEISQWNSAPLSAAADFVYLYRTITLQYDGLPTHTDTATSYKYDASTGFVAEQTEFGTVIAASDGTFTDTGTDRRNSSYDYVRNGVTGVIVPISISIKDQSSLKLSESKFYYDNGPFNSVTKGNQTKQEQWISGATYASKQKAYNTFGNVTSETDPLGNATSYVYDSYNLYPATVTNAILQPTNYVYDYGVGKVSSMTDANGNTWMSSYDGFGRPLTESIPDPAGGSSPVLKTAYVYTDTSNNVLKQTTQYLDASNGVEAYEYFDGLGRSIQTRKESETAGMFNTADTVYDSSGRIQKQSLPYSSGGALRTPAITIAALYSVRSYDALSRVTSEQNSIGTTTNTYAGFKTKVTDPMGKVKNYFLNAYGKLIQVDEINAGSTYTTQYLWNVAGQLVRLTDALGNIRDFTYDGRGNRLTAQDLHAVGDTSFGTWQYAYDTVGNLIILTSPEAKTTYKYDGLNRQIQENYTGATGTEIAYAYDACANGKGKLCSVTMLNGVNTVYGYDKNGTIATESRTIGTSNYFTSYVYDRQGNQSVIIYPDGASVRYTYNTAGLVDKAEAKENATAYANIVSNIDYSPTNMIATMVYANGVTTTNTYDAAELYRLNSKKTLNSSNITLQDLTYTYDVDGNITQLVDASATNGAKMANYTYDDLNRLLSATITNVAPGQSAYTQTYAYNVLGNILSKSDVGSYSYLGSTGTSFANPHAATSVNGTSVTYNRNGDMLTNGQLTNTWNYKDELVKTVKGSRFISYLYDHAGNRVYYNDKTNTTHYPNKYYNTVGSKKTKQIYVGNQLVGTIETVGTTITPYYVHTDTVLGSNVISDAAGAKNQLLDYYPFGEVRLNEQATGFNEQKQFIGQEYDADTGLNYLNARYYGGDRGQFISQDPMFLLIGSQDFNKKWDTNWRNSNKKKDQFNNQFLFEYLSNPQNLNSYSYGLNNPITMSDPTGLFAFQLGLTTNIGLGGEVGSSFNIGFASDGTFGISKSLHGGGLAGADASIGISAGYSNAKTWNDTLGTENYASLGGKVLLGGDVTTNFSGGKYSGTEVGIGMGARLGPTPIPVTFSGGVNKTTPVYQGNISGIINGMKNAVNSITSAVNQGATNVANLINKLTK